MAKKRIVTKVGDVFCAPIGDGYKRYFQFIAIDRSLLNSSTVRVFKSAYPLDENPKIEQIVKDAVGFYSHTVLRAGIEDGVWYKVGTTKDIGEAGLEDIWFGTQQDHIAKPHANTVEIIYVNPLENWWIWHINKDHINIGRLPDDLREYVEPGGVFSWETLLSRIKYGYYVMSSVMFDVLPRRPWPEAHSYLKKQEGEVTVYYHFLGEYVIQQLIVMGDKRVHLTAEKPAAEGYTLRTAPFYTTNWKYPEFIEQNEFDEAWRRE